MEQYRKKKKKKGKKKQFFGCLRWKEGREVTGTPIVDVYKPILLALGAHFPHMRVSFPGLSGVKGLGIGPRRQTGGQSNYHTHKTWLASRIVAVGVFTRFRQYLRVHARGQGHRSIDHPEERRAEKGNDGRST